MSLRIAYARIAQETNAYSPVETVLEDFRRTHWLEGEALAIAASPKGDEAPGFARHAELAGFVDAVRRVGRGRVEGVPLLSAWAIPSGPLSADTLADLRDRLVAALRGAGKLDGVYLALHGAMSARGEVDPEARLIEAVREVVGPDVPIAASFDLHGQMTREKLRHLSIATAYRTNPHRDHARVGFRTGEMLVRTVLGELRPVLAWRSLPLVLGGGTMIDFLPTMRPIHRWMRRAERDPAVLYASLFHCHVWNDHPDLGWSVIVLTDGDAPLAERLADELADRAWAVRDVQLEPFPDARAAIAQVRAAWIRRRVGTVCLSDASDAVGAGAPGEATALLRALLEHGRGLRAYASIRDATAVGELWDTPEGSETRVRVGGRLQPELNEPLDLVGRVGARHQGTAFGRRVVLELEDMSLVVTEFAPLAMKPAFYEEVGLDPWRADLVVVKSLYPFRWYYLAQNRMSVYVRTDGVTDLDWVYRIQRRDPVHPRDPVADWHATDQRRRGVTPSGLETS